MSNQKAKYRVKKIVSALISSGMFIATVGPAYAVIPEGNTAAGGGALAVGTNSIAGINGTAVGTSATSGNQGTAVGTNSQAATNSTAIGYNSNVSKQNSVGVGENTVVNGSGSVALGDAARVDSGINNTSIGATARTSGTQSTAVGYGSAATNQGDTAIGTQSTATSTISGGAIALGNTAKATGDGTTAIGLLTTVSADRATALGTGATASAVDGMALGGFSTSSAQRSTALGYRANASIDDSVAIGSNSTTSAPVSVFAPTLRGTFYPIAGSFASGVVSIGSASGPRQLQNVAAGRISATSTDGVNGAQLNAAYQAIEGIVTGGAATPNPYVKFTSILAPAIASGTDTSAVGPSAFAGNNEASAFGSEAGAIGIRSTAVGTRAGAIGNDSLALGANAFTDIDNSVALGAGSVGAAAVGNPSTTIRGITYGLAGTVPAGSVSVGSVGAERQLKNVAAGVAPTDAANVSQVNAVRQSVESLILGGGGTPSPFVKFNSDKTDAQAVGNHASAVGPAAQALGDNSSAYGADSLAREADTTAIGTRAAAIHANSVAIGNDSVTQAPLNSPGMTIRGTAYTFDGSNPAGSFSVGSPNQERQIQNVAAGVRSTDAVNMGQFNALAGEVNSLVVGGSGPATTVVNNYNNVVNNQAPFFNAKSTAADSQANGNESISVGGGAVATSDNSIAIGGTSSTTGSNSVALGFGSSATGNRSVALGAGTAANRDMEVNVGNRTIGGVANAQYADQAVNLGQMQEGDRGAVSEANSYTDARSAQTLQQSNNYTDQQVGKAKKLAYSAAAMGMAASGIVMSPDSEKAMGVGVAAVNGSPAVALRFSWRSKSDRRTTYNVTGAAARGMVGVAGAINWQWE